MLNKSKLKSVLHYIIHNCNDKENISKTIFYKLLYFSDFNYYELYEKKMTNEEYIKLENGPFPKHFDEIIDELLNENLIDNKYTSIKEPKLDLISKEEIEVIDEVIKKYSNTSAKCISSHSREDLPYQAAEFFKTLNYELVFYRSEKFSVREYL